MVKSACALAHAVHTAAYSVDSIKHTVPNYFLLEKCNVKKSLLEKICLIDSTDYLAHGNFILL